MTAKERIQKVGVAYNILKNVLEDTDEEKWAYQFLEDALIELDKYFEEYEV